ncbi:MAG: hypothetical protein ACMVY4_13125 [Minwuia sp.]|uniref:hypothetical protein n=1 Tax=Minwuia sp. TaxID=2493630 RepID=UPI003A89661B
MKDALAYLIEGMLLMRQAPGLFLALITASAAIGYYSPGGFGWIALGISYSILYYYWGMRLTAQVLSGQASRPLAFLQVDLQALVASVFYPFLAMLWGMLVSMPVWLIGSIVIASVLGSQVSIENEAAMAEAMRSPRQIAIFLVILLVTFVIYLKYLSNRITVPIVMVIWGADMRAADSHAGPASKRRFTTIIWIFALPIIPSWGLTFAVFNAFPDAGSVLLLLDFVAAFCAILPIVATTAYVYREIGPPRTSSAGT